MSFRHLVVPGVQRCGTTSLLHYLGSAPGVVLAQPQRPEPKFFLHEDSEGQYVRYVSSLFPRRAASSLLTDKSTSYAESVVVLRRIAKTLPSVKIVIVLRHPAVRAWSHYCFSRQHGVEDLGPERALLDPTAEDRPFDANKMSVSPYRYVSRGRYAPLIVSCRAIFGESSVRVLVLEEVRADPTELHRLLGWLEVEPGPRRPFERLNGSLPGPPPPTPVREYLVRSTRGYVTEVQWVLGRPLPWSNLSTGAFV